MVQTILVGLVAGVGAALLFVAPFGGTPLAIPLFALTGLPIAIAGFGWGSLAAALAVVAGAGVSFALAHWTGAAVFALLFAIPVAWATAIATQPPTPDTRTWQPLGLVLTHAAGAVALGVIGIGVMVGFDPPMLVQEITAVMLEWATASGSGVGAPPTAADIEPLVALNVALLPATAALLGLLMVVAGLYLGALAVRFSDRQTRPVEDVATVALPPAVPAALAGATLLAFLPGPLGHAAEVVAGALGGAVALLGMAVLHALTRGTPGRPAVLGIAYVLTLLSGLPIILFALLGIAESVFHLRARRLTPRGRTPT